jgi:crotonobetainyl-CoA:carnitine CoA-transferase CaiB-like acyl-CoA transferase
MTRNEAARRLGAARTAFGFVNELADLARHPALRRVEVATSAGPASIVAPPAIVDGIARQLGRVPDIGEHSEALRAEFG